ncbi:transglycosylase SLT domain-containing protein [Actimicrobium sp. CCC2.4]|uniref:transglycosylase SLT domain-containing protein n=1 Tax=Actimicrobium sp. CCC2.4 TaxID=3048606 RepID=UPI002AC8E9B0|nr:transglycosylase SLT domain-containing protein [Actimicrobium sp. CCC2.4]MEB0137314.1 transglycosylase SLT domain-containing protein [Actimicrobium sp. CCC2.4]WPX31795.1 transglycosylase SLT domain-containing protein [Actimicrobium sp. CCC2.4]
MYLIHGAGMDSGTPHSEPFAVTIQEVQLLNRFTRATHACARHFRNHSTNISTLARDTLSGFFTTAHHALMISGIAALCTLALMFYRPDLVQHLKSLTPSGVQQPAQPIAVVDDAAMPMDMPNIPFGSHAYLLNSTNPQMLPATNTKPATEMKGTERQQQWVSNWISKRYRVANDATAMLVSAAYTTANDLKIDPLLILAVVAIESGFNPFAESAVGAQGLMQIMSKIHHEKFEDLGGIKAALNPVANIRVGASILKDYVSRGGSVEAGLKMYVGAAAFDHDDGYGSKVLAEYQRLKTVASGKTVSVYVSSAMVHDQPKVTSGAVVTPKSNNAKDEQVSASEAMHKSSMPEQVAAM